MHLLFSSCLTDTAECKRFLRVSFDPVLRIHYTSPGRSNDEWTFGSHLGRRGAANRIARSRFKKRRIKSPETVQEQVKSLSRVVQVVLWGILLSWLLQLLQRWIFSAQRRQTAGQRRSPEPKRAVLHRDPCCGTYVSPEISFPLQQAGQIEHFCSAECRERFLKSERQAATA